MTIVERTRDRLGPAGVWLATVTAPLPPRDEAELVRRLAGQGYGSVFSGEGPGTREVFAHFGTLLARTADAGGIVLGTGIANAWSRPGRTAQSGGATLAQAHPGRFVLGVGIGHAHQAAKAGSDYRPLAQTRAYLAEMADAATERPPAVAFPRVLAAVGPKMLELARDHADGAHPYAQPFEHTAYAREILGPDKLLIPHQAFLFGTREDARARLARTLALTRELGIPHYLNGWKRLGYREAEIDGLSDRFVDGMLAWGDEEAVVQRVRDLLDAGADHVLLTPDGDVPDSWADQLKRLAPVLAELRR